MYDPVADKFESLFGPEFGHGKPLAQAPLLAALEALGWPNCNLGAPVAHVAGTNGKGSTIAFMRAVAEAAGLKVHAFTKPHLLRLNERFLIAGEIASDEALISGAERVHAVAPELTQFDAQVAAAFLLFDETSADMILLETGMGGRDDSTNVVPWPALTIISPIALDHQDALGGTLAEIAAHKAGIMKRGSPAIVARQEEAARVVIEAYAQKVGAPLYRQGVEWDAYASNGRLVVQTETRALDLPLPSLHGAHQIDNAGLACAALLAPWRYNFDDAAFAAGIANARLSGRMQPLTRGGLSAAVRTVGGEVWIDGGHNAHAAAALSRTLAEMKAQRGGANVIVVGLRARKDAGAFIEKISASADLLIATPLTEEHVPLGAIAQLAAARGVEARTAPSLSGALHVAVQSPAPRVLICGSFLLAAEALRLEGVRE